MADPKTNPTEDPTPRQSGTWGVLLDVCQVTGRSLSAWAAENTRDAPPLSLSSLIRRAQTFETELQSWKAIPPDPKVKRDTIDAVFQLRTDALELARRFGRKL